jgi:CRP-like cAMP-binding protein
MKKLKAALSFGSILSKENIEIIISHFKEKKLEPGEEFLPMGKVSDEIGFIDTGIVRTYIITEQGEEVTRYFFRENQFIVDIESFYNHNPTIYPLQAVTKCQIYFIKRKDWAELTEKIPQLFILTKSLSEALLLNKLKDIEFLNYGTATEKYKEFLNRYPDLALYVPQQYIASYLKITPQSLSRIRKSSSH